MTKQTSGDTVVLVGSAFAATVAVAVLVLCAQLDNEVESVDDDQQQTHEPVWRASPALAVQQHAGR